MEQKISQTFWVFLSKRDEFLSGHAVSPKTKLIINEVFDSLSS